MTKKKRQKTKTMPPFRPDHAKGYFFLLSLQHKDAFLFASHHLMFCFQGQ